MIPENRIMRLGVIGISPRNIGMLLDTIGALLDTIGALLDTIVIAQKNIGALLSSLRALLRLIGALLSLLQALLRLIGALLSLLQALLRLIGALLSLLQALLRLIGALLSLIGAFIIKSYIDRSKTLISLKSTPHPLSFNQVLPCPPRDRPEQIYANTIANLIPRLPKFLQADRPARSLNYRNTVTTRAIALPSSPSPCSPRRRRTEL
jgi:hypothetical protein